MARHGRGNGLFVGRGATGGGLFVGRGGQQPLGSRGLSVGRSGNYRRGGFLLTALGIGGGIAGGNKKTPLR